MTSARGWIAWSTVVLLVGCVTPPGRGSSADPSPPDGARTDGGRADGGLLAAGDAAFPFGDAEPAPEEDAWTLPPTEPDAPEPPEPPEPADPPDPSSGPVERTYRVLHWNVAGALIHHGRTDTGLIREITGAIRESGAQLVGINELCRSQFDALERALRESGWPRDPDDFARFAAGRPGTLTPGDCGAFGVAIFSRPALGPATRFELPSDGSIESRWLICAPLVELGHLRFCVTHLTPRLVDGDNRAQVGEVLRRLEAYRAAGDTVIVTGDFNTEPDAESLDAVYAPGVDTPENHGNTGEYRELDDDDGAHCRGYGEATGSHATGGGCGHGRKIDFIFVRRDRIVRDDDGATADYWADSRPLTLGCPIDADGRCSDHRMVTGRVRVRVER